MKTAVIILLLFCGTAWGSEALQGRVWFRPQPLVSFTNWPRAMSFIALDIQDQSALLWVEIIRPSVEDCEMLGDCDSIYQVERWRLPDLTQAGISQKPVKSGELTAARLAGNESFLFYRDQLVITDLALNVRERVAYPEDLQRQLDGGTPFIGVAASGKFAYANGYLWDRQQGRWSTDHGWGWLIGPQVVMGAHRVMAVGSFHSNQVWLVPYQHPQRAKRFAARNHERLFLSPDERRLLIQQRNGLHRLIDVESQRELQRWRQRLRYQEINWRYNRSLMLEDNGRWSLHQLEPHRTIVRGTYAEDGFAIIAEEQPIGVLFDSARNTGAFLHLLDGRLLGQQALPELADSSRWLQWPPLPFSQRPLTLLLEAGVSERGIQQFRPYRLEVQPSGKVIP